MKNHSPSSDPGPVDTLLALAGLRGPDFEMNTSMETRSSTSDRWTRPFEGPSVTSFGQSADAAMLEALMKRARVTTIPSTPWPRLKSLKE